MKIMRRMLCLVMAIVMLSTAVIAANACTTIAVGKDADFVLLSEDLVIDTVIAKGQTMVVGGEPIVWGTFEEKK